MYILIAVASRHGSTREIAETIAQELRREGHTVALESIDKDSRVGTPDAAIIGSAVYLGDWLPEAREFVERDAMRLADIPVWLFSSGPLGHDAPQPQGDPAHIQALMAATIAREHRVFVGKLDKHHLGIGERLIARVVKAQEGDFRDWEAVRAWARTIAEDLVRAPASQDENLDSRASGA